MTCAEGLIATTVDNAYLLLLDRPEKRNALNEGSVLALHDALDHAPSDPHSLLISASTPSTFAAGADLRDLLERDSDAALRRINAGLFDRVAAYRWPTIAVIDGPAVGAGFELALSCDFRVASGKASFGLPETQLGLVAGAGGLLRLPGIAGTQLTRRLVYLGQRLDASGALEHGVIDLLSDDPLREALTMASTIASRSWRAVELSKLALRSREPHDTLTEVVAQAALFDSDDKRQRVKAVIDQLGRTPAKGRP